VSKWSASLRVGSRSLDVGVGTRIAALTLEEEFVP
jgi:hypothetical protein